MPAQTNVRNVLKCANQESLNRCNVVSDGVCRRIVRLIDRCRNVVLEETTISYVSRDISAKNHVRRSLSSIQTSIRLAVATSLWGSQISCGARGGRGGCWG